MICKPSRATGASRVFVGACCRQAGYECGTHRRQAERVGEHVVGQRPAEVGQQRRLASRWCARSKSSAKRTTASPGPARRGHRHQSPTSTIDRPCATRCAFTCSRRCRQSVPTTKRSWQCARPPPGSHWPAAPGCRLSSPAPRGCSSRKPVRRSVNPGSPQSASIAGSPAGRRRPRCRRAPRVPRRESAAAQPGDGCALAVDERGDRRRERGHRIAQQAHHKVARVVRPVAQREVQVEVGDAARAEEESVRPVRRRRSPSRRCEHVGGRPAFRSRRAQPKTRRADLLPISNSHLRLKPSLPALWRARRRAPPG